MAYNHALEEKKFKELWNKKESVYRESGMTEEQISAIREYDVQMFNLDRAFYRRTTLMAEPEHITDGTFDDHSDTYLVDNWSEFIDCEETYYKIMKVPSIMRKAFYMYRVLGYSQNEISLTFSIPQRTISYWIKKIVDFLNEAIES